MSKWGADCPLTDREISIMEMLAQGLVYKQIADNLGLKTSTIRTHLHHIYGKLNVGDRAQAVLACARRDWVTMDNETPFNREEQLLVMVQKILNTLAQTLTISRGRANVTPAQRRYLQAFQAYLKAPSTTASEERRALMVRQMELVLEEADMDFVGLNTRAKHRFNRQRMGIGVAA